MPIYPYRCPLCDVQGEVVRSISDSRVPLCPECNLPMRRVYTPFAFKPSMPAHFNASTGTYVSNSREFADDLKRRSEAENIRHREMNAFSQEIGAADSGEVSYEVNLQPVDPADQREVFGITDEGLEATAKRRRDTGMDAARKLIL